MVVGVGNGENRPESNIPEIPMKVINAVQKFPSGIRSSNIQRLA
jgi:hypothetical protein